MRKTKVKGKENLKGQKAITLIALVVTIIVLLILARGKHSNTNWTKWNINTGEQRKNRNKRSKCRRGKRLMESK